MNSKKPTCDRGNNRSGKERKDPLSMSISEQMKKLGPTEQSYTMCIKRYRWWTCRMHSPCPGMIVLSSNPSLQVGLAYSVRTTPTMYTPYGGPKSRHGNNQTELRDSSVKPRRTGRRKFASTALIRTGRLWGCGAHSNQPQVKVDTVCHSRALSDGDGVEITCLYPRSRVMVKTLIILNG